jgi:alginate O-acetyltransferase complex protein AlgI
VTDFWKRWHISLTSWMKDYLYVPLGGNRGTMVRTIFNLWVVFLISGFWHGAKWTFVAWGAFHGAALTIERFGRSSWIGRCYSAIPGIAKMIWIFFVVNIGWVIFRSDSLASAGRFFYRLSHLRDPDRAFYSMGEMISNRSVILMVVAVALIWGPPTLGRPGWSDYKPLNFLSFESEPGRFAPPAWIQVLCMCFLVLATLSLINSTYNPFIYYRF